MSWINFFFFVIVLNTLTGTVAYFLCKLLAWVAERIGAVRIIYPMYRLVQVFYIVPIGFLYNRFRYYFFVRTDVIGDLFLGNEIIRLVVKISSLVWIFGMIGAIVYYIWKYRFFLWVRWKNVPFFDDEFMDVLKHCYPKVNWDKVTLCTNFMVESPCVMGTFRHELVLPEVKYPKKYLEVILMHEATHIARHDNLWKKIAMAIAIINWFNYAIFLYVKDLDEWSDTACDVTVCNKFFDNHSRFYFEVLLKTQAIGETVIPPFVSQLNKITYLTRRVERMVKWTKNGKKVLVSFLLTAVLVMGSSVSALAASVAVADMEREWYQNTREQTSTEVQGEGALEEFEIPAEEVDEEKWESAVVYGEEGIEPLSVQKFFDWTVPVGTFARSTAFIKKAGTEIIVSCYVNSSSYHHVGIRRPNGSMLYVNVKGQVTHTFSCETFGTYYVYVENMGSTNLSVAGYYIK